MLFIRVIELISHEPFIDAEHSTGLQDTCDLCVDCLQRRCVNGGFDGVDEVEMVVWEWKMLLKEMG